MSTGYIYIRNVVNTQIAMHADLDNVYNYLKNSLSKDILAAEIKYENGKWRLIRGESFLWEAQKIQQLCLVHSSKYIYLSNFDSDFKNRIEKLEEVALSAILNTYYCKSDRNQNMPFVINYFSDLSSLTNIFNT